MGRWRKAPSRIEERDGVLYVELCGPKAAGRWFRTSPECRHLVENRRWTAFANGSGQIYATTYGPERPIFAHRLIAGAKHGELADHADRDTSNNFPSNLRICTTADNSRNQSMSSRNTSGIRGVRWEPYRKKWLSRISVNDRSINLGRFAEAEHAAAAYRIAAAGIFGDFVGALRQEG